jgi:hypothetical protein
MKLNDVLQWIGAAFLVAGHVLNAIGPSMYPWNILAFGLGTICFMVWSARVANKPQMVVNIVSITACAVGLFNAWG